VNRGENVTNYSTQTINCIELSSNIILIVSETPSLLTIVLPVVLGVVFIILVTIAGLFYYRRRKQNKKPGIKE
jgi:uncharacterized integral membrane protein